MTDGTHRTSRIGFSVARRSGLLARAGGGLRGGVARPGGGRGSSYVSCLSCASSVSYASYSP